jgi:predicted phosphodiesterase
MRVLIVSDIHANVHALNACMDAAPAYDLVWNLGDVVGYGASPNDVCDISRELGDVFVRGNHDKACSGASGLEGFNPVATIAALWTQKTLTPNHLEWLKNLPHGPVKPDPELDIALVHGAPLDEDQYMLSVHDASENLERPPARLTFFGHTHIQGGFVTNGREVLNVRPAYSTREAPERLEFPLEKEKKYMINPGSIGQPRDQDPRAAFALYDTEDEVVTFYRVAYDIEAAQKAIYAANLPPKLGERLAIGR